MEKNKDSLVNLKVSELKLLTLKGALVEQPGEDECHRAEEETRAGDHEGDAEVPEVVDQHNVQNRKRKHAAYRNNRVYTRKGGR